MVIRTVSVVEVGAGIVNAAFSWDGETLAIGVLKPSGTQPWTGCLWRAQADGAVPLHEGPILGVATTTTHVYASTIDELLECANGAVERRDIRHVVNLEAGPGGGLAYARLADRSDRIASVHLGRTECRYSTNRGLGSASIEGPRSTTSIAWSASRNLAIVCAGVLYLRTAENADGLHAALATLLASLGAGETSVERRDGIPGVRHVAWAGSGPEERLFVVDARGRVRRLEADGASTYPIVLPTSEPAALRRLGSKNLCCASGEALIVIDPATLSQVAKLDLPGAVVAVSPAGPRIAVKIESRVEILELTLAATVTVPPDPLMELIVREGSILDYVARRDHPSCIQPLQDAGILLADAGHFELSWDGWMRSTRAREARAAAGDLDAAIRAELGQNEPSSMIDFEQLGTDLGLVDRDLQLLRSAGKAIGFGTITNRGLFIPRDTDARLAFHAASLETWLHDARIRRGRSFAELEQEIAAFEVLAVSAQSDERKTIVRRVENDVRDRLVTLSPEQFRRCRSSELALARILAYLYVEHARLEGDLEERRSYVVTEWEYVQRLRQDSVGTMMPLYYAIRCYRRLLKTRASPSASADLPMFAQIRSALTRDGRDAGMQIRNAIEEIEQLLEPMEASSAPSVGEHARRGAWPARIAMVPAETRDRAAVFPAMSAQATTWYLTVPLEFERPEVAQANQLLATAYVDRRAAIALAESVGVSLIHINREQTPFDLMRDIMRQAAAEQLLERLLKAALSDARIAAYHAQLVALMSAPPPDDRDASGS